MNNRHLLVALMITVLTGGVSVESSAQTPGAPPPPKPECKDIVYRKWNDFLFIDNGNEEFVSYQWYRNQAAIEGETKQYFYSPEAALQGDGNIYHAVATKADGTQVISCEGRFEDFGTSVTLNPGKIIRRAVLYSYTGDRIGEWNAKPESPAVQPGCYVWVLTDDKGNMWSERVLY